MNIQGIGSCNPASYPSSMTGGAGGIVTPDNAVQQFESEMKESPMERMVDAWLKAHGLTRASLAKLPPDQQQAIMKQMAKDIADEVKRKVTEKQKGVLANVTA